MDKLISLVSFTSRDAQTGGGDSFVDRLNCRYTVFILSVFAIMVTTKHYAGEPINCWCPSHFTDSHVDFTNAVCWTTDTYYLSYEEEHIPKEDEPKAMIGYYQWVPLILSCQAILFYLPRPIWMILSKKSGVSVTTITDAAVEVQTKADPVVRQRCMMYMTNHMGRFLLELMSNHAMSSHCRRFWWRIYGKYLVITYLLMKLMYLANAIGQLFMLDRFLGLDYHLYGIEVLDRFSSGRDWRTSDRFPRVTICDLKIRTLGNIHRYSIQCSLPMNLLNEIIFIFIWFWLAFVCLATILSLIKWLFITTYIPHQIKYMHSRLIAMSKFQNKDENIKEIDVWDFVRKFLRRDGCLLIRLVSQNASDIIAAELICELWKYFLKNRDTIQSLFRKGEEAANYHESNPFLSDMAQQLLEHGLQNNGLKMGGLSQPGNDLYMNTETQTENMQTVDAGNMDSGIDSGATPQTQPMETPSSTAEKASFNLPAEFYPECTLSGRAGSILEASSANNGKPDDKGLKRKNVHRKSGNKK